MLLAANCCVLISFLRYSRVKTGVFLIPCQIRGRGRGHMIHVMFINSRKNSNVSPMNSLTSTVRSPYLWVFIKQQIECSEIKKNFRNRNEYYGRSMDSNVFTTIYRRKKKQRKTLRIAVFAVSFARVQKIDQMLQSMVVRQSICALSVSGIG